jgi:hypothetical protein
LQQSKNIPVVGGTKDLNWERVAALKPDLLILDQEENLKWMKEQAPCLVLVGHVTSIESMAEFSMELARNIPDSPALHQYAPRWRKIIEAPQRTWNWLEIPGAQESWVQPSEEFEEIVYMIWKKPWMKAGSETFIESVFERLGASQFRPKTEKKYPTLEDIELEAREKVFLFSSEPFPFARESQALKQMTPGRGAIVEGEGYSWFGVRSLEFLERSLKID